MSRTSGGSQNRDRFWIQAMVAVVILMVFTVAIQQWHASRPPAIRLGTVLVQVERQGNQVLLPLVKAPQLATDGAVVAINASPLELFVVRVSETNFVVWDMTTTEKRRIRYDSGRGIFVDQRDDKVGFSISTGEPLSADVKDRLRKYLSRTASGVVEITLQLQ